ncbi:DNA polymerase bacteriophage-type [Novimethylophilus kurashikiensis]|uniref:DNA polymerase bacteriophage-type n=1 Tax=Novimethylophilus kurashikiensis TaxID=1825523 RepID=A0A2R5F8G8_9PROT|nr:uracil-DNA glycosylase [Novimethylophilus kurashikiensis]GBG14516.1 DNA polymerase bacteriophage-type [Novimethylophilus kurashikiensis]
MTVVTHWQDKSCQQCPSLASCRTQIVVASPCRVGGLLAIGEAPGADEDVQGVGFVGTAGKTLDRLMLAEGVSRDEYGRANICRCRPPENRKPSSSEIKACIPYLANLLETFKPRVVLAVGGTPTAVLSGAGTLYSKLEARNSDGDWSAAREAGSAHPGIQDALRSVEFLVPMPHTSPLAFNRNAPSGEKWANVAARQVALAVALAKG